MCGIVAVHDRDASGGLGGGLVDDLVGRLRHRGPDDRGVWVADRVALGHARLSIIDVPGGHQPLGNEDGALQIVYNGEVYNFLELRAELEGRHVFTTRTDTEVIVHLYEEEGPDCLRRLDGMFALAIRDGDHLFLARDPLGIKPLYYAEADGRLYFGSEIKALLPVTDEVKEFPPGHSYHTRDGWRRYFDLEAWIGDGPTAPPRDPAAAVREVVTAAVVKRLIADVPVGVFLSGGLDSSLVAALMRERLDSLHSFSVGTATGTDPAHAREVARALGTEHHERIYTDADVLAVLPRVIQHLESFDFALVRSAVANYLVAQLAAGTVKVVLAGEGADELFGGYHYLKELPAGRDLATELLAITGALHNSNLQRVDRMTMAHGLEGRVPFLDLAVVRTALALPPGLKHRDGIEKWILRHAFEGRLNADALWREKEKFSRGAGSAHVVEAVAEREISDRAFEDERHIGDGLELRSKEELYYYRIWRRHFPPAVVRCLGWTARPEAR